MSESIVHESKLSRPSQMTSRQFAPNFLASANFRFAIMLGLAAVTGGHMDAQTSPSTNDIAAAEAALLTIRAALAAPRPDYEAVVLLPDTAPLLSSIAARRMAALPKPLFCRGVIAEEAPSGVIIVECQHKSWPMNVTTFRDRNATRRTSEQWLGEDSEEARAALQRAHGTASGEPAVLLAGCSESMILGMDAYTVWLRDYQYLMDVAQGWFDEDSEAARRSGASVMMRIGPSRARLR